MPESPRFFYFISSPPVRVLPGSDDWRRPLPLARAPKVRSAAGVFCHGDYFRAAETFLKRDGLAVICAELGRRLQKPLEPADIDEIRIRLEKHGEFYHPARIDAVAGQTTASFVLNVAVSETGRRHISREYRLLRKLNSEFSPSFLPRVFGRGEVRGPRNFTVAMFLGQWFEDYHEVHLAREGPGTPLRLEVWDAVGGRFFMTPQQAADFYRRASRILTGYYRLETFEQIGMWHHGAGDFVVRLDASGMDVKLVTVRRYAPLFKDSGRPVGETRDPGRVLQALLIFFLNLSLRMRLDRLAGVGEVVWAPDAAVDGTLTGFLDALALKDPVAGLPASPLRSFSYHLATCSREDLLDLVWSLSATFNVRSEEAGVIKRHISEHVDALQGAIVAATT